MEAETIDYRLTMIEKSLEEIKSVVIENRLQRKDIEDIKTDSANSRNDLHSLDKRVRALEMQPAKEKAARWQGIVDAVYKMLITAIIGYAAVAMGLKI